MSANGFGVFVLRAGISVFFILLAIQQLTNPSVFENQVQNLASIFSISPAKFVFLSAIVELAFASLLFLNTLTIISSICLGAYLFLIAYNAGLSQIGISNLGLAIATLSIVFLHDESHASQLHMLRDLLKGRGFSSSKLGKH